MLLSPVAALLSLPRLLRFSVSASSPKSCLLLPLLLGALMPGADACGTSWVSYVPQKSVVGVYSDAGCTQELGWDGFEQTRQEFADLPSISSTECVPDAGGCFVLTAACRSAYASRFDHWATEYGGSANVAAIRITAWMGATTMAGYILAASGTADCTGCGQAITSYDDCATAAASGAAAINIAGLYGRETWDGTPGCHIQDGSNFQFNTNMQGGGRDGHTPVCLDSDRPPASPSPPEAPPLQPAPPSTFIFFPGPANFPTARTRCQQLGGDLASIHSAAENAEANALTGGQSALIGFTDAANEGTWVWPDGTSGSYTSWDFGQPANDGQDEDCAAFLGWYGERWHDVPCDWAGDDGEMGPMGFLCSISGPSAPPYPPDEAPAPPPPLQPSPPALPCISDDSKCSSVADDCCACDASIGQTGCGFVEAATCRDGWVPGLGGNSNFLESCSYT